MRIAFHLLVLYFILSLAIYVLSDSMMFYPPSPTYLDRDIIKIKTSDGIKLNALYLQNPRADFTILYSHGNAEDLGMIRTALYSVYQAGFSVFAYDYRGYGGTEGLPSEETSYTDIEAAYRYMTSDLKIPSGKIVLLGRSIGGGPAFELASKKRIAGLIAESTFTTALRVVTRLTLFPFDRYRNIKKLKHIKVPLLVIHGTEDRVISPSHGREIFEKAEEPKMYFSVEGAGHNNILRVDKSGYVDALKRFRFQLETRRKNGKKDI